MEQTISIKEILTILKKWFLLIFSLVIVFAGIAAAVSYYLLPPVYQAQTQLLVNQKGNDQNAYSWSQMEMDLQLINTYNVIIQSPAILDKVIKELNIDMSSATLSGKISLSNDDNSKVVNLRVEDEDPKQAVSIANKVAGVFKEEIPKLMSVDNLNILSPAVLDENPTPIKPNKFFNIGVASVIGMILGIVIALLLEILNTKIRNEKDIVDAIDLPIMGVISPMVPELKKQSYSNQERRKDLV